MLLMVLQLITPLVAEDLIQVANRNSNMALVGIFTDILVHRNLFYVGLASGTVTVIMLPKFSILGVLFVTTTFVNFWYRVGKWNPFFELRRSEYLKMTQGMKVSFKE